MTMKASVGLAVLAHVGASQVANSPCCVTCESPLERYYSVDNKHGHCGESCMNPKDFWKFKPFEPNLTIADGSTGYSSCADLGWPVYLETVSHGVWPIRITLDLYDHTALEVANAGLPVCPPKDFSTTTNFDLDAFVNGQWHIHQQMETRYLPKEQNRCVTADYTKFSKQSWRGYDIGVHNHAEEVKSPHKAHDTVPDLCAKIIDGSSGKLAVAPCFIANKKAGDYWVVAVDESEGYALVSGGAPTISAAGGCQTHTDTTNQSGLWIFTRTQRRDESLVQKVRKIAAQKGFDLSVLNDVDHTVCNSADVTV